MKDERQLRQVVDKPFCLADCGITEAAAAAAAAVVSTRSGGEKEEEEEEEEEELGKSNHLVQKVAGLCILHSHGR